MLISNAGLNGRTDFSALKYIYFQLIVLQRFITSLGTTENITCNYKKMENEDLKTVVNISKKIFE